MCISSFRVRLVWFYYYFYKRYLHKLKLFTVLVPGEGLCIPYLDMSVMSNEPKTFAVTDANVTGGNFVKNQVFRDGKECCF